MRFGKAIIKENIRYLDEESVHYYGGCIDDLREGLGIQIWENGNRYEGCWKNNERSIVGQYIYQNSTKSYYGTLLN